MGEVDETFIQDPEHRPCLSIIEAEDIPLIDLSPIITSSSSSNPKAIKEVVKQIGSACKEWGFLQVINHGVPVETRHKLDTAVREFFKLPLEEKRKVRRDESKVMGYYDAELTKNVRDWKEVLDFVVKEPTVVPASPYPDDKEVTQWYNQWPEYPPQFREACEEYNEQVVKLGLKLMELIAMSLDLPANRFHGYFEDETSNLRINYYPPCPSPHLALGLGRHKDGGALTVLAQDDVGGLEIKRKTDGEWIRVKPIPHAFVINISNILQVWSNDRYDSVEHRALVNSEKERLSIGLSLNPAHYTLVKPLEELTDEQNPPKFRPYSWGKFMTHRKLTNFKKLNIDNIQIDQLRILE
ncbi:jasmonate-induced oxygenase 2 isoform X2 [Ziziphus jujuba]|uniref:Jasmonate-induced oxygenase 2 isoform X2 n=2 Tax=Ziziphus jujuba TaxID=326968 RepID=A0A6P3Z9Q8_ZIZJJ|nr:jasmonate-induced oxygenase 2 isoform X2 [Ziziphus jujuba]KAH7517927.1 hypothetical protein FEM48_Zijuj09G0116100 [Ziziphus jujuba var. spinosa]